MKKLFTLVALFCVLSSASLPILAQKARSSRVPTAKQPAVSAEFGQSVAFSNGTGSYIRWQMAFERGTIGFNVYRITSAGQELASRNTILGSKARFGSQPAYGEEYDYFDERGGLDSVYVIESIDSAGQRIFSGKIGTLYSETPRASAGILSAEPWANGEKPRPIERSKLDLPLDLAAEVAKNTSEPDPAGNRAVVSDAGVKIGIKSDGFFRVTRTELQNAGFDVNTDPANWKLFANGVEQAMLVEPGGNYVEFLGKYTDTIESDKTYYFLVAGASPGRRMDVRTVRPNTSTVYARSFQDTYTKKERVNYINTILNGDAENYWGNLVASGGYTMSFNLSGVDSTAATAVVEVRLQGFSATPHSVVLRINGQQVGTATGSATDPMTFSVEVPVSLLLEGANALQMTSGASNDYSLFDSITIRYKRNYAANQNRLAFYTWNYRHSKVTGFASQNIRVFDTTLDGAPVLMDGLNITQNGATYDVDMPAVRGRVFYAVETAGIRSADTIQPNYGSNLMNTGSQAKLLILTHRDFLNEANAWATYRRTMTFPVEVVDVDDIYDEFNYGRASSASISAFLNYAFSNWQTPPEYVLILGDGSYDPKNYQGFGYLNFVPSKMVNTIYSETSSDEAMADFNNDGLAEMAIGRVPARTGTVVANALAKVMAFETPAMQDMNRGAIFAFDNPDGFDFEAMSQTLRNQLPPTVPAVMVGRAYPNARTLLINEINNGRYIVNYSGHGSTGVWAATSFFGINDVPLLTNANNQSIFTMLTCLNGYFIRPDADSLAELLLKAQNGGAVAAWASTGSTTPDVQLIMGTRFFNQIGVGNITRIGDLIRDAKSAIPGGSDVRLSWALIGDPMLKVR